MKSSLYLLVSRAGYLIVVLTEKWNCGIMPIHSIYLNEIEYGFEGIVSRFCFIYRIELELKKDCFTSRERIVRDNWNPYKSQTVYYKANKISLIIEILLFLSCFILILLVFYFLFMYFFNVFIKIMQSIFGSNVICYKFYYSILKNLFQCRKKHNL